MQEKSPNGLGEPLAYRALALAVVLTSGSLVEKLFFPSRRNAPSPFAPRLGSLRPERVKDCFVPFAKYVLLRLEPGGSRVSGERAVLERHVMDVFGFSEEDRLAFEQVRTRRGEYGSDLYRDLLERCFDSVPSPDMVEEVRFRSWLTAYTGLLFGAALETAEDTLGIMTHRL